MSSLFSGLNISVSGLFASQRALNVNSHNIANVNTPGYTRQRLEIIQRTPMALSGKGMLGMGVDTENITQLRDEFLDLKFRDENTSLGEWKVKAEILETVETVFNEPSDSGIRTVMDKFFGALQQLHKTPGPENIEVRALVRRTGISLAKNINNLAEKFKKMQKDTDFEIKATVNQVNGYADQIAGLNEAIYQAELDGTHANDLRDQRNLLLDELSELTNINYFEDNNSKLHVLINGISLVSHNRTNKLICTEREIKNNSCDVENLCDVRWESNEILGARFIGEGENIGDPALVGPGPGFTNAEITNGALDNLKITVTLNGVSKEIKLKSPIADNVDLENDINAKLAAAGLGVTATVNGAGPYTIEFGTPPGSVNKLKVDVAEFDGPSFNPKSGKIRGLIDMRDNISGNDEGIPYYMERLNNFADVLTEELNRVHKTGYDLDGNTGTNFFTIKGMTTAEYDNYLINNGLNNGPGIEVTAAVTNGTSSAKTDEENNSIIKANIKNILSDPAYEGKTVKLLSDGKYLVVDKISASELTICKDIDDGDAGLNRIAASATLEGIPGNGENALKLSKVRDDSSLYEWGGADDYIKSLISNLGVAAQEAIRTKDNQTVLKDQADTSRQSMSGVSLDEELADMIRFQNTFNANSRMITTIDEMIDTIINRMGTVGR